MAEAKQKTTKKAAVAEAELMVEAAPAATDEMQTTADVPADVENDIVNAEVGEVVENKDEASTKSVAKAGKRSAKAVEAA